MDRIEKEGSKFKAHEVIYLQDLICQLLNIPITYPSLHNTDAAAFTVMLSSALHQWMDLSVWLGQHRIDNIPSNALELLDDYRFRDLIWGNAMILQQTTHYAFSDDTSEVPKNPDSLTARENEAKRLNYIKILPMSLL